MNHKTIATLEKDSNELKAVKANQASDEDTGKVVTYRQLMQNPRYKNDWSIASANEFGRLASGVGG